MKDPAASTIPQSPFGGMTVYYRLVALWVVCEAMLGGIIHGLRLPVSGLVVGSCAIVCICLIARYVPERGSIIKATIIVAIFKMMLSPQAPPPAYIAVFFQGALGEVLFWKRKYYAAACIALAVLGLLESGLQRILVLTIVSGNDLWVAINSFLNGLTKQKETTNYSFWIGGVYVAVHLFVGLIVGWWASQLPKQIITWKDKKDYLIKLEFPVDNTLQPVARKKRKRLRLGLFIAWVLLIGLYIQSYYKIGTPLLSSHISLKILLRSLIIVLSWVFLIGPILTRLLHQWLKKKQSSASMEVKEVLRLLPITNALISESWARAKKYKGWTRISSLSKIILVNSLTLHSAGESQEKEMEPAVYILTSPIGSGKTTSVIRWAEKQSNIYGIVTPEINGKRVFQDIHTGEQFAMEAEGSEEVVEVGRFKFSKRGFERASQIIRDSIDKEGWLVIDEIGPLEFRGEGFHNVFKEALDHRVAKLLLVVRKGLSERMSEIFTLPAVVIVNSVGYLTDMTSENVVSDPHSA